jgi:hypothetical protein
VGCTLSPLRGSATHLSPLRSDLKGRTRYSQPEAVKVRNILSPGQRERRTEGSESGIPTAAPKERKNAAHGASRGSLAEGANQPRKGRKNTAHGVSRGSGHRAQSQAPRGAKEANPRRERIPREDVPPPQPPHQNHLFAAVACPERSRKDNPCRRLLHFPLAATHPKPDILLPHRQNSKYSRYKEVLMHSVPEHRFSAILSR